jgi:hypothetical protein
MVGLADRAVRSGHQVTIGCEIEQLLIAPALSFDPLARRGQLALLMQQLILGCP